MADLTWGSQSWLQPPFEAAPRAPTETDLWFLQIRDFSHAQRGRLKGGCSQDWLPHVRQFNSAGA